MPSPSWGTFGGGGAYQKKRKSGPGPKTKAPQASKEKRGREPRRKKQKNDTSSSSTRPNHPIPAPTTTIGPNLVSEEETSLQARLSSTKALHTHWKSEDTMVPVKSEALITRQRQRCKDMGMSIFGFVLQKAQVDAIHTLFYEQRDLLLLAKIEFGKSLIFQLMPFFLTPLVWSSFSCLSSFSRPSKIWW